MQRSLIPLCAAVFAASITVACDSAGPAAPESLPSHAATVSEGNLPFYARMERPFVIHTDDWAAIVFYRPPSCVRADFNLLDFFDIPGAFSCAPQTVAVRELRKDPDPFAAPFQASMKGLGAVPVWLFSWTDMQAALADDVVTIAELQSLPSWEPATATLYEELLQPTPARIGHLVMNAVGTLADGRSFLLHSSISNFQPRSIGIEVW